MTPEQEKHATPLAPFEDMFAKLKTAEGVAAPMLHRLTSYSTSPWYADRALWVALLTAAGAATGFTFFGVPVAVIAAAAAPLAIFVAGQKWKSGNIAVAVVQLLKDIATAEAEAAPAQPAPAAK